MTNEKFQANEIVDGLAVNASYIYVLNNTAGTVTVYRHNGTYVANYDIPLENNSYTAIAVNDVRLYVQPNSGSSGVAQVTIETYSLAQTVNYQGFVPIQFDTDDFNNFFILATNTLKGDITRDSTSTRTDSINTSNRQIQSPQYYHQTKDSHSSHILMTLLQQSIHWLTIVKTSEW